MKTQKTVLLASILAFSLASCGDDDDRQQPGTVPPVTTTTTPPPPGGLDWESVSIRTESCPSDVSSEPPCRVGTFRFDDEGSWRFSSPSGHSGKASESDVLALDARVDAIKDSVDQPMPCQHINLPGLPHETVTVEFQGRTVEIYRYGNGGRCYRGDIGTAESLVSEIERLRMQFSCGCFDGICVDCMIP